MCKRNPLPVLSRSFLLFGSQELRIGHLGNSSQVWSHLIETSKVSLINSQTDPNLFLIRVCIQMSQKYVFSFFLFMFRKFLKASTLKSFFFRCIAGIQNSLTCFYKKLWYLPYALCQLSILLKASKTFSTNFQQVIFNKNK